MNQQRCENCKTPVFRPDCHFVMSCPVCVLIAQQSESARADTFNAYFAGTGLYKVKKNQMILYAI